MRPGCHPNVITLPPTFLPSPSPINKTRLPSSCFIHQPASQQPCLRSFNYCEKCDRPMEFEDFLPTMADKLGGERLMGELCNGFNLLMDQDKGVITFDSLKRNSALLGLSGLKDDELRSMLREGDTDGDGALNQMEFCILMFRLSPDLMEESRRWLDAALEQELENFMTS